MHRRLKRSKSDPHIFPHADLTDAKTEPIVARGCLASTETGDHDFRSKKARLSKREKLEPMKSGDDRFTNASFASFCKSPAERGERAFITNQSRGSQHHDHKWTVFFCHGRSVVLPECVSTAKWRRTRFDALNDIEVFDGRSFKSPAYIYVEALLHFKNEHKEEMGPMELVQVLRQTTVGPARAVIESTLSKYNTFFQADSLKAVEEALNELLLFFPGLPISTLLNPQFMRLNRESVSTMEKRVSQTVHSITRSITKKSTSYAIEANTCLELLIRNTTDATATKMKRRLSAIRKKPWEPIDIKWFADVIQISENMELLQPIPEIPPYAAVKRPDLNLQEENLIGKFKGLTTRPGTGFWNRIQLEERHQEDKLLARGPPGMFEAKDKDMVKERKLCYGCMKKLQP